MRAGKASISGERPSVASGRPDAPSDRCESAGFSYVEMLVAIVLVGVAVIAILVGLRATMIAGRVGTEQSQLLLWAQDGAEALHRTPYEPCSPDGTTMSDIEADLVHNAYQAAVDGVTPPDRMSGGSLVVAPPQFLSIDPATLTERWDERDCDQSFDVAALRLTATSPDGTTVDLEVIVDG